MAFLDVSKLVASRDGTTLVAVAVLSASVGRGNDSVDSGLDAFPVSDGLQFRNDSRRVAFMIENTTPLAAHVKINIASLVDGQPVTDRIVTLPHDGRVLIGPFPTSYNTTSHEDSDEGNPSHTDYIQLSFAIDDLDSVITNHLKITPIVIPTVS